MSTVFDEQPDLGEPDLSNMDLEDRHALRRVAGLSTELQDITEVEYRALRLERVVLIGVWTEGTLAAAENSLREVSRLAETAGAGVLGGLGAPGGRRGGGPWCWRAWCGGPHGPTRRPTSARARPPSWRPW